MEPKTVDELIKALGGTTAVAVALFLPPTTVSSWKASNSIPKWRKPGIVDLCLRCGVTPPLWLSVETPRRATSAA